MTAEVDLVRVYPRIDPILKIGQIRRIQTNGVDAKLVVIYKVNAISRTCDVILLDHNLDNATKHDFLSNLDELGSRFGHVVLKDFKGNIESAELKNSLVYAEECQFCITAIGEGTDGSLNLGGTFPFDHDCYVEGTFLLRILSDEWLSRNLSYKDFFEACNKYLNYDEFIALRETINFFYSHNSTLDLRKNITSEINLHEIRNSISQNKYAKMLVRS
jgi:hypothetical protein